MITDKSYVPGCLVLLSSLKHHGSKYPLVAMVTPLDSRLPQEYRDVLAQAGCIVREIKYLVPEGGGYTGVEARFVDSWTKLRAFGLSEYERLVLIDSDMLARKNMDELLDMPLDEGWIAGSHVCTCNPLRIPHYPSSWIPENCAHTYATPTEPGSDALCIPFQPNPDSGPTLHSLNSGIVALTPSDEAHKNLEHALHNDPEVATYNFPDQDFLSNYFKNRIKFLGYEYNALKPMRSCHSALWRDEAVRNCHYILKDKPWVIPEGSTTLPEQFQVLHGWWWDEWRRLEAEMQGNEWWGLVKGIVALSH